MDTQPLPQETLLLLLAFNAIAFLILAWLFMRLQENNPIALYIAIKKEEVTNVDTE